MLAAHLVLFSLAAPPRVATVTIEEMAQFNYYYIVVADVERITERAGMRVASASVVENISGIINAGETVEFVAESTWTCDVSDAEEGERALLFFLPVEESAGLTRYDQDIGRAARESRFAGQTLYRIDHAGGGRIVLKTDKRDKWRADVTRASYSNRWSLGSAVELSPGTRVDSIDESNGRVSLSILRGRIWSAVRYSPRTILRIGADPIQR